MSKTYDQTKFLGSILQSDKLVSEDFVEDEIRIMELLEYVANDSATFHITEEFLNSVPLRILDAAIDYLYEYDECNPDPTNILTQAVCCQNVKDNLATYIPPYTDDEEDLF